MRRGRNLREHRSKTIKRKVLSIAERRKLAQQRVLRAKGKKKTVIDNRPKAPKEEDKEEKEPSESLHSQRQRIAQDRARKIRQRRLKDVKTKKRDRDYSKLPACQPLNLGDFQAFDKYSYTSRPVKVCHVIESYGLGGAQTMMLELVNGLNAYFGDHIQNYTLAVNRKRQAQNRMTRSYGVEAHSVAFDNFRKYLKEKEIDIVLHHRIAISKCLKSLMPKGVKYILLNHTWNGLQKMQQFYECDVYLSVCKFLHKKTRWHSFIHDTRRRIILNGVENKYLDDIEAKTLAGDFATGRCHRCVSAKFRSDSLVWLDRKIARHMPGFSHYLLGTNKYAKQLSAKYKWFNYMGSIDNRQKKMSYIKGMDVYYYETYQDEGASIAILEALSCGVPVLAKPLGGTPELVTNGINGFHCKDPDLFVLRLQQLNSNRKFLKEIIAKTKDDFEKRLHVKHTASKYAQLFEAIIAE